MSGAAPMPFALLLDRFDPARGGTERYLGELAARLAARGHSVRVYCREGVATPAVTLVPITTRARTRGALEREFAMRASERARTDGCAPLLGIRHVVDVDVYQPHGGSWGASIAARLAADRSPLRRGIRRALHAVSAKQRWFHFADREVFARNPRLLTLAVSSLVRDDLLGRFGELKPRIELLPPAIDLARFAAARTSSAALAAAEQHAVARGSSRLLFLAHDFELKGLAAAIGGFAASDAARRGGLLLVAGRGRAARYAALAKKLGVGAQVRFLGMQSDSAALLGASDLLLHPTHYDPCALVTLEALAAGVPVVTSDRNGAAEFVAEGGGRVVAAPSADAVAGAAEIAAAIDSTLAERESLRTRAAAVGARFGWDGHVARFEALVASR